jgi:TfoX/Sxy family transcriptional regulator of competence genes
MAWLLFSLYSHNQNDKEMASDQKFVNFIVDQLGNVGSVEAKMMFGGHTLYADGKILGLIGDNKLFIKPTNAGREFIQDVVEAPPYPGAKNCFLIAEKIEDREWLCELARISLTELPMPKVMKTK